MTNLATQLLGKDIQIADSGKLPRVYYLFSVISIIVIVLINSQSNPRTFHYDEGCSTIQYFNLNHNEHQTAN